MHIILITGNTYIFNDDGTAVEIQKGLIPVYLHNMTNLTIDRLCDHFCISKAGTHDSRRQMITDHINNAGITETYRSLQTHKQR